MVEQVKVKFVPKVRKPHRLQEELIQQTMQEKRPEATPQSVKKDSTNSPNYYLDIVSRLYGVKKKVIHYFVNCCRQRHDTNTGPVVLRTLCLVAQAPRETVISSIKRLINEGYIIRKGGKPGKGGFSTFELEPGFIDAVSMQIEIERNFNPTQSSSNFKQNKEVNLPAEWLTIDTRSLETYGFGTPQLWQLYNSGKTSPQVIQDSINRFAYTMQYKPEITKKYRRPLAVIMKVLLKGECWTEEDYISPQELTLQKINKLNIEEKERIEQLEKELFSNEYKQWKEALSPVDQKRLVADTKLPDFVQLKNFFKNHIWPKRKSKLLS